MQRYGYIRVSNINQNIDQCMKNLIEFGVAIDHVYIDYADSDAGNASRREFRKMLKMLYPGDIVIIENLNMLSMNYTELINEWRNITQEREAHVQVLDMPLLDTTFKGEAKAITGAMISDIFLVLLEYVEKKQKEARKLRQKKGMSASKAKGKVWGRKKIERPVNYEEVKQRWQVREITLAEAAQLTGVSLVTFRRWLEADKNSPQP